ncbi:MAG: GT2 family glycosyltransferase [Candidatus Paceibacteria bacterium]|jgi:GT2 family glycosyltransferase
MSAPQQIFAVVVNWNGGDMNRSCLQSLLGEGITEGRIVFVDNGSVDGSLESVRLEFPGLVVIENGSNLGFGEGANLGARRALECGADAVYFINNDLTLEPGSLARLVHFLAAQPEVGICGPRVLDREDPSMVWCAGGMLSWRQNLSTLRGHKKPDGPAYQHLMEVDYIPGCALLIRATVLYEIGGFDADYFAYMEDVDLCVRAKKAGFGVALVGETSALHASSSSTGGGYNPRRKYMMGVNSIWFLKQHGGLVAWARFVLFDILSLPLLFLFESTRGNGRAVIAKGRGILDGLRGRRVTADAVR